MKRKTISYHFGKPNNEKMRKTILVKIIIKRKFEWEI
jgi:hypothetical protein